MNCQNCWKKRAVQMLANPTLQQSGARRELLIWKHSSTICKVLTPFGKKLLLYFAFQQQHYMSSSPVGDDIHWSPKREHKRALNSYSPI